MSFKFSTVNHIDDGVDTSLEALQEAYDKLGERTRSLKEITDVMSNVDLALTSIRQAKNAVEAISIMNMDGALDALLGTTDKLSALETLNAEALTAVQKEVVQALEGQDESLWDKFKKACASIWQAIKDFFRRLWWRIRSFIGPNREVYKAALMCEDVARKIGPEVEKMVDDFVKEAPAEMAAASEAMDAANDKFVADLEAEVNRMSKMSYDDLIKECDAHYQSLFGESMFDQKGSSSKGEAKEIPQEDVKVSTAPYATEGLKLNLNIEGGILEYKEAMKGLTTVMQKMKDGGIDPAFVTKEIRHTLMSAFKDLTSAANAISNEDIITARQKLIELLSKAENDIKAKEGEMHNVGIVVKKFEVDPNEPSYDIEVDFTPPKKELGEMGWDFHKMIEFSKLYADTIEKFDVQSFERYLDMYEKLFDRLQFKDDVSEENKAWVKRVIHFAIQEVRDALKIGTQWQKKLSMTSKMCLMFTGKITKAFKTAIPKRLHK